MALVTFDAVLGCLNVRHLRPGVWTAPNLKMDYPRIFGGQMLAQAVALGAATTEAMTVKSLACLFTREGSTTEPLEFRVSATHTGRTFAARNVHAVQNDRAIFSAQILMHVEEAGPDRHDPAPDVGYPSEATEQAMNMIPWTTRVVKDVNLRDPAVGPPDYAFWTRVEDPIPNGGTNRDAEATVHQALLAYASDLTVVGTVLRPVEGVSQADSGHRLHTAVISHSMWFHRRFRIDDWCLIHQHSPTLSGARGFGHGHVFDAGGAIVAGFAQECMIRPIN